jgi:hypothetical protein
MPDRKECKGPEPATPGKIAEEGFAHRDGIEKWASLTAFSQIAASVLK